MSPNIKSRDTRHIMLARSLHARLYVSTEGRIFVAGGRPDFDKLSRFLSRQECRPTAVEAPSPSELGIAACDGELSPPLLHSVSRALHRWQLELEAEAGRRPAQRRQAQCIAAESREIERLTARLQAVRQWQAQCSAGNELPGAPYFLDPGEERELRIALEGLGEHLTLSLTAWHARVVRWLAGESALRRYVAAVVGLFRSYPQASRCEQVRDFQRAVILWKRRSATEQHRNLRPEIALHLKSLSPEIVREAKLSPRLRGRTLAELCDLLLNRCNQFLQNDHVNRWHAVPAALAALIAADGSAVPLPQSCFRAGAEQENFAGLLKTIGNLAAQAGEPGYDRLLAVIDQLPQGPREIDFAQLRRLLARGCSLADAAWACEQGLFCSLEDTCLSASAVRKLGEAFAERGWPLDSWDLSRLVNWIRTPRDRRPIDAWLGWLGSVSRRFITPRLLQSLKSALWERYLPSVQRHRWFEPLAPCLQRPRKSKDPSDVSPLLERIAEFQQLAGKQASLPKSIRKLLQHGEVCGRELAYLRELNLADKLDADAAARLSRLEVAAAAMGRVEPAKLRRAAEEAYLLLSLEAQGAILRRLAEESCRAALGNLVPLLPQDQLWDFAGWIASMKESQRERLRRVISMRSSVGREYKQHLGENRTWIGKARLQGLDLDAWFAAEPQSLTIGDRALEIRVADELQEIFQMGQYFRTCLSLGDVNEMSVLANACDANKQVVFLVAHNEAGQPKVIGRQLIAISKEFKLVGYRTYLHWGRTDKAQHDAGLAAMEAFCGRFASRCGVELADQGTPETIGNHFWYDDGECAWSAAAKEAWNANEEGKVKQPCPEPRSIGIRGEELAAASVL